MVVTTTEIGETTMRPTPGYRARLGIELVTAYLGRTAHEDAEDYITARFLQGGTDTYDDLASGLLILAELLALKAAREQYHPDEADLRAKAHEVLQDMALHMPE
jgi:hypothetical protein